MMSTSCPKGGMRLSEALDNMQLAYNPITKQLHFVSPKVEKPPEDSVDEVDKLSKKSSFSDEGNYSMSTCEKSDTSDSPKSTLQWGIVSGHQRGKDGGSFSSTVSSLSECSLGSSASREDELGDPVSPDQEQSKLKKKGLSSFFSSNPLDEPEINVELDSPSISESEPAVNWKLCFICGSNNKSQTHKVNGSTLKENLMKTLAHLHNPESEELAAKIRNVDLVAVEARYHAYCLNKFKRRPTMGKPVGRNTDPVDKAMEHVYAYLDENYDRCQFSVADLSRLIPDELRPHNKTILDRILNKYGKDNIVVHGSKSADGTIVCFKTTSERLLLEAWKTQKMKSDPDDIKNTRKVAATIREKIRCTVYKTIDEYPPSTSFMDGAEEDVHELLKVFLDELILPGKRLPASWNTVITTIGHIIMKATRPRCFSSRVLLGLGCFLKKKFGSRYLIDCLAGIGLSCSYSEIQLLENCYIASDQPTVLPTGFFQWVADNADFNINTLDGHNSWHVMALIQCVTPSNAIEEAKPVTRNVHERRSINAAEIGNIELVPYESETYAGLGKIQILDLNELYPISTPTSPDFNDLLFAYGKWKCDPSIPSWNGFMEQVTEACSYETSKVMFHPFINAKPTEKTTVNTTLSYVFDAVVKSGRKTPIVNFDQQLYWIARDIVANLERYKGIFVRLGGFHLLMSFLGAIGKIMSGSGLEDLWATIYAEGSIPQMIIGKSYARAVRAHLLTNLSLAKIILDSLDEEEETFDGTRTFLDDLLNNFDRTHVMDAVNNESSVRFAKMFEKKLSEFESRGPTAKLWVQYYRMTCLVKHFLEAERSGNWSLYVSTIRRMVPYFYFSGHNNYAKSAHLYLQDIATLEEKMTPEEFQNFTEKGFFTIRRSDKFFCGISPDQTIEQTTMRLAKTQGGLTLPGRGITESETAKWTLSMYSLMNVCEQFETYAGVYGQTSEQHVDLRPARVERDNKDVHTLDCWFATHNPFPRSEEIVSLGTGVVGDATINCHLAEEEGNKLMSDATDYTFKTLSFKREKQVKPLSIMTAKLKVDNKVVAIDPMLIFQRIAICGRTTDDIGRFFDHELAPYPMSLFDEKGMRKGTKSSFYEAFTAVNPNTPKEGRSYVIDGGYLLHKVRWKNVNSIQEVCRLYVNYLQHKFSDGKITVIFDGYPSETDICGTKSAERHRRSSRHPSASVDFDYTTSVTVTQDDFLSNDKNKNGLIQLIQQQLQFAEIETEQAFEDADHLIVTTALQQSSDYTSVTIVGEDIDLLVLLVALGSANDNVYFKKPSNGKNSEEKIYSTQSFKYADLRKYVLLLHAFTGCDTTSAPYSQGKLKLVKAVLKILEDADKQSNKETEEERQKQRQRQEKKENILAAFNIFYENFTSTELVETAGRTIFSTMYNGASNDLAKLRFKKFSQCATKTKVNLCSLPPSPDAANFHSRRVYLQVQAWLGKYLEPTIWGWKRSQRGLEPIMTVNPPAPSAVMDLISCSCKVDSTSNERSCGSRCGCRKAGVPCSVACINCSGEDCSNAPVMEIEEDTFLDDDDLDFPSQIVHFSTRTCSTEISNPKARRSDRQSPGSSTTEEGARSESPEQEPVAKKLRSSNRR